MACERSDLERCAKSSSIVFAKSPHADEVVNMSTSVSLSDADAYAYRAFSVPEWSSERVFYFRESILNERFRGGGVARLLRRAGGRCRHARRDRNR